MEKKLHRLCDYAPLTWHTLSVGLYFDISDECVQVINTLKMTRTHPGATDELELDGEFFTLKSFQIDGAEASDTQLRFEPGKLFVRNLPDTCTLTIQTVFNPRKNHALDGFYADGDLFLTQCEPEGFRRITYFMDRPDNMSVYTVTMEADARRFPILLANGECRKRENLFSGRHRAVWHDPFPKPSYLFAAVAGNLAEVKGVYRTGQERNIALGVFVPGGKEKRVGFALDCLKKAMAWDEERFGLECDLDTYMIVATDTYNAGAMENKGLNIFNSRCILADPESATDADFESVDRVIAHEYFHNWTGNRVTCRDWFQVTLKEGLTVFRDAEYTADTRGAALSRIRDVADLRAGQFAEDASPLSHPIRPETYMEINNFYTSTVYQKGAEVIRMIQTLSSREAFRKGLDIYFDLYDGQAVTTEDFLNAISLGTGLDLSRFKRWYVQKGTPVLTVTDSFDPDTRTYTLFIRQSACADSPLTIPVQFGLLCPDSAGVMKEGILVLEEKEQVFSFQVESTKAPVPSLLRGFSAPVILNYPWTAAQLTFIAVHDTDLFCAWEALQTLMKEAILHPGSEFATAARLALKEQFERLDTENAGFAALALNPPSLSALAASLNSVDYPALHQSRQAFMRDCACSSESVIRQKLIELKVREPYAPVPEQIARRNCRSVLLRFAAAAGFADLRDEYANASNMSEILPVLTLWAASGESKDALAAFREKWKDDALVICKYFAVQASADCPDVTEKVCALECNSLFDLNSPNKVNALYGSFIANAAHFHAPDGKGYAFIAERIKRIDALNPQLAASLAKRAFSQTGILTEPQHTKARGALASLLDGNVSVNLSEIIETLLNKAG